MAVFSQLFDWLVMVGSITFGLYLMGVIRLAKKKSKGSGKKGC